MKRDQNIILKSSENLYNYEMKLFCASTSTELYLYNIINVYIILSVTMKALFWLATHNAKTFS